MTNANVARRFLVGMAIFACAVVAFAGQCAISDYTPGDVCPLYDNDCDSISNVVETLDTNRVLYHFDPSRLDPNPSVAHGLPGDGTQQGTLEGGLNLPDFGIGIFASAYYHYYQPLDALNSNDWGTLALVNTIEGTGRLWAIYPKAECMLYASDRAQRFGAGDLSQFGGSLWWSTANPGQPRHYSHQNGRDVDVRFLRLSHREEPLNLTTADSTDYDQLSTINLMRCFVRVARGRVVALFVDTVYAKVMNEPGSTVIVHDTAHRDHFHVRITDPDGPSN